MAIKTRLHVLPSHARFGPRRIAKYLRWWERRPSQWLAFLRDDHEEELLRELSGAEDFHEDEAAHAAALKLGLLVRDPRPDSESWNAEKLTGRGLCFVHEHYPDPRE